MVLDWTLWHRVFEEEIGKVHSFDVRVFNLYAQTYRNSTLAQSYRRNELEKNSLWQGRSNMVPSLHWFSQLQVALAQLQLWSIRDLPPFWLRNTIGPTIRHCIGLDADWTFLFYDQPSCASVDLAPFGNAQTALHPQRPLTWTVGSQTFDMSISIIIHAIPSEHYFLTCTLYTYVLCFVH